MSRTFPATERMRPSTDGHYVASACVMRSMNCRWGFEPADRHAIRLLEILGQRAFNALQDEFGGKRVWVPKAGARFPCAACKVRAGCVRRWRKAGRSPQLIAEHLGVSAKTVYRLLDLNGHGRSKREKGHCGKRAIISAQ